MLKGLLTKMLKQEYIDKGYRLTEDEDFLYLYLPGTEIAPIVFNARNTKIEQVNDAIRELEK